ncbi:MAG: hypothetical protein V3V65_03425, partial [Hyphomicrobium sp.]
MNTPVRIILYVIVLGVIGWFVWRFYIEPKVDTATTPAVDTTPAPAVETTPAPAVETAPAPAVETAPAP